MPNLQSPMIDPIEFKGVVEEFEASSSGVNSGLFSFYLDGASFQIRHDTPTNLFTAMAAIVSNSWASGKSIAVTTYEQLPSGVYLVNLIRNK